MASRIIGRDAEIQRLFETMYAVIEQRSAQMITVVGPPGIGKSRLLAEFRQGVGRLPESIQVFRGRATPQTAALPYGLIRTGLSFYFGIRDSDPAASARAKLEQGLVAVMGPGSEPSAHAIGHMLGFDYADSPHLATYGDTRQIRDYALQAALRFMSAITAHQPAIIILEDLHLADESSLDLLEHLTRNGQQIALLLVAAARRRFYERRPGWGQDLGNHQRIDLQPLSEHDSRRLVAEILRKAGRIPPDVRNLIVSRAEGNPFYMEELIKMLIEDGVIVTGPEHWQILSRRLATLRVPPTLTALVRARLDLLSPAEQRTLERAAVVGRVFWDQALVQMEDDQEPPLVAAILAALVRKEMIFEHETSRFAGTREFFFKQALLHEVIYERVPLRQRTDYHARVAAWLVEQSGDRAGEHAGPIAEHYQQAGDTRQVVVWYERAAQQSRASYAPEVALGYYRRALDLLPADGPIAQRIALHEGIGKMLDWLARHGEAAAVYTTMHQLAVTSGDTAAQTRALIELALVQNSQLNPRAALESAVQAEALARATGSTRDLIDALLAKGWAYYYLDNPMAIDVAAQALGLSQASAAREQMAGSLSLLGATHGMIERYDLASDYETQALAIYRELDHRKGETTMLNNLGHTAELCGDWERAADLYRQAIDLARAIGNRDEEIFTLTNFARTLLRLGDVPGAERAIHEGMRLIETYGKTRWSSAYSVLAEVHLRQGEMEEARAAARTALDIGTQMECASDVATAWRVMALVMAELPETAGASACFAESARAFANSGYEGERARTLRAWASYELHKGNHNHGAALWEEARAIFTRLGLTLEVERMNQMLDV